MAPLDWIDSGL